MRKVLITTLVLGLGLLWATGAWALTPPPMPQFFFTGFIQEATLDTTGAICTPTAQTAADGVTALDVSRLRGGTMTVNGIKMIVPCNTLLQLPAATMMWADLFDPATSTPIGSYIGAATGAVPANPTVTLTKTGLALADNPMPFPSFAVNVNGNVVNGKYIVGLIVPVTQQDLNASSGLVTYIDYAFGSFRVGGIEVAGSTFCDPTLPGGGPACPGALVQFNDPVTDSPAGSGRWGLTHSIDPRFSGDDANTTIHTSTGIPLCIPGMPAGQPSSERGHEIPRRSVPGGRRTPEDLRHAAAAGSAGRRSYRVPRRDEAGAPDGR